MYLITDRTYVANWVTGLEKNVLRWTLIALSVQMFSYLGQRTVHLKNTRFTVLYALFFTVYTVI